MALAKRGPKTEAGKLVAAMNSTRHGILSPKPVVAAFETAHGWNSHRESILDSLKPEGGVEQALAERVALNSWSLNRVAVYETEQLNGLQDGLIDELREHAERYPSVYDDSADAFEAAGVADKRRAIFEDIVGVYRETSEELASQHTMDWLYVQAPYLALEYAAYQRDPSIDLDEAEYDLLEASDALEPRFRARLGDDYLPPVADLRGALRWLLGEAGVVDEEHYTAYECLMEKLSTVAENALRSAEPAARKAERRLLAKRRQRVLPDADVLQKIARYEAHLSREMYRALHELEALQTRRTGGAAPLARVDVQGLE
jgi:hypothetical protein